MMSKLISAAEAYTFDDFVLVPKYSEVKSRSIPDLTTSVPGFQYKIPVVASPMNTVTEADMLVTMAELGGVGVLHRYISVASQLEIVNEVYTRLSDAGIPTVTEGTPAFYVAVGANGDVEERVTELSRAGVLGFCVDVANGHNELSVQAVRAIRRLNPEARIMAGNVCTFDGACRLAEAGANSLRVGIGSGCHIGETRVLMANGTYKNIKDVAAGDRVINRDGLPVNVIKSWCTGTRKVMRLKHTQFYTPTYVTPDHKYWVGDMSNLANNTIRARGYAKSVKEQDLCWQPIGKARKSVLTLPNNIHFDLHDTFNIPIYKRSGGNGYSKVINKLDCTLVPSYDIGYIFGMFLGDGNANLAVYKNSRRGSVRWYLGKQELPLAKKLAGAIKKSIDKDAKITQTNNMIKVVLHYKPLAEYLSSFDKKDNKHLPEELLVNNKEYLKGMYDGLIDSDGHIEKSTGRVCFGNTSTRLIELFGVLEYMINGQFPNYQDRGISCGALDCDVNNLKNSYSARKLKVKRVSCGHQLVKILDTSSDLLEVPVYDIEVDCPTHSFIANNAVVHNSMCTTRQVTGHGLPQLSAIEDCVKIKWECNGFSDNSPVPSRYHDVAIIADGGIRKSGDIIKALAIGADAVMLGSLLAGTEETPGKIIEENDRLFKYYRGMASNDARSQYGGQRTGVPEEGVSKKIPYTGKSAKKVVENLCKATQVGLSFSGAHNLEELRRNAEWRRVTGAGFVEGTPHGK